MHEDKNRSPLTAAFAAKGLGAPDFALFCALPTPLFPSPRIGGRVRASMCAHLDSSPPCAGDFASLFQQPREEPTQVELFKAGLKASNVWYGHESTVCWMQTELPPGIRFDEGIAQTYDESGWCFVEAAISAGLKVGTRRLDLAKRTDRAMEFAYGGSWPPEYMLEGVCAAARPPPLLPDEVRRRLEHEKKFTSPRPTLAWSTGCTVTFSTERPTPRCSSISAASVGARRRRGS